MMKYLLFLLFTACTNPNMDIVIRSFEKHCGIGGMSVEYHVSWLGEYWTIYCYDYRVDTLREFKNERR